jgi:hypothetical protein
MEHAEVQTTMHVYVVDNWFSNVYGIIAMRIFYKKKKMPNYSSIEFFLFAQKIKTTYRLII